MNKLGWEKRLDQTVGPDYRFMTVAPLGWDAELSHVTSRKPGGDTGISLSVADLEETYTALVDKGVTFTRPLEAMPWAARATWLQDPDGNTFFFIEA